jgi:uncharacterized protein (TIGR02594 family)
LTILDQFIKIAEGELDVHESSTTASNKRILEYDATTTLKATSDKIPWCSAFCNWVVREAGCQGTNSAAARSWLDWGKEIDKPITGCIVVLSRCHDPQKGHVGFFFSQTKLFINILGGNQNKSVCYEWFSKYNILSYRVPEDF